MNNLKTVFWDLDGTIADTELNGHRIAYNEAFNEYSLKWNWTRDIYLDLLNIGGGKKRMKFYSIKQRDHLTNTDINHLYKLKTKYYQQLIETGAILPRRGVLRLINELNSNNISQWVVTTSGKDSTEKLISTYFKKARNPFSGLICGEDVINHKPSPEAYNLALSKSNSTKENAIVIEDSLIGLYSACAANLKCILTLCPWNKMKKEYKKANLVFDHLGDEKINAKCLYGYYNYPVVDYKCLVDTANNKYENS